MKKGLIVLAVALVCCQFSVLVFADTITTQYSTDGYNWVSAGSYTATQDTTVYCRVYNATRGTASTVKSVRLLVDKQAPTKPAVSYVKNGIWTNNPPVMSWSSSDTGGSGIRGYQLWRSDTGRWLDFGTGTSWTPEQNKQYTVKWRAVDGAGNTGAESAVLAVKTDNTPPGGLAVRHTPTSWTRQVTATAAATDVSKVRYRLQKGNTVVADFGDAKSWVLMENGGYTVTARDEAGNTSNRALTVGNVDRKAPEVVWRTEEKPRNEAEVRLRLWDDLSNVEFVVLPDGTKWYPGVSE